jgi:hypothetical protein
MTIPVRTPAPIGTTDELREYAADKFALAELYCRHAADLALAGDDLGLETATRKLIATVTAAAATVNDLRRGRQWER